MTAPIKNALQSYQTIVYDRVLHPEWFDMVGRRQAGQRAWELEAWLTPGGHVLRFEHGEHRVSELVTYQEDNLPNRGVVLALPSLSEKDVEHEFSDLGITYYTGVTCETLSRNLYLTTLDEMREHIVENDSLHHYWEMGDGPCLSVLDMQAFSREVHVQSYHLLASSGVVVRTQTIFEHAQGSL